MSVKVSAWVWENGPEQTSEKLLLLALADHANDDGICYPSVDRLSIMVACSPRHVRRLRDSLIEQGYLSKIQFGGMVGDVKRSNVYKVNYKDFDSQKRTPTSVSESSVGLQSGHPRPENGRTGPENGHTDPPNHQLTINEPSNTFASEKESDTQVRRVRTRRRTENDEMWDAMVEVFGQPSTATARSLFGKAIRELLDAGGTPEDVLARSAEAKRRWNGNEFSPVALLKWWDSLASKQETKQDLKGNAQLGKSFLTFEFEGSKDLVEKLGAEVFTDD
jgi:hypothetical protein